MSLILMYITEILMTSMENSEMIINNILELLPNHINYILSVDSQIIHPSYKYTILSKIKVRSLIKLSEHIKKNLPKNFTIYDKFFYNYPSIEALKLHLVKKLLERKNMYQITTTYTSKVDKDILF